MNKKAFTLVELLAVIIILGLLVAIAIPSVSRILAQTKKKGYLATVESYATAASMSVNVGRFGELKDQSAMYYLPVKCLSLEKGGQNSPTSQWVIAYIISTYNGKEHNFYHYFKDQTGLGLVGTKRERAKLSDIVEVNKNTGDLISVEGKTKAIILNENTCNLDNLEEKTVN